VCGSVVPGKSRDSARYGPGSRVRTTCTMRVGDRSVPGSRRRTECPPTRVASSIAPVATHPPAKPVEYLFPSFLTSACTMNSYQWLAAWSTNNNQKQWPRIHDLGLLVVINVIRMWL